MGETVRAMTAAIAEATETINKLATKNQELVNRVDELTFQLQTFHQLIDSQSNSLQWYSKQVNDLYYGLNQARLWARMWKRAATVLFMVPYRDGFYCFRYIRFVKDHVVKPAKNGIERWWEGGHAPRTFFNRDTSRVEVKHD